MPDLTHISASSGRTLTIGGFGTTFKIHSDASGGSIAIVEHTLAPGLLGAPPHRHAEEDETSYVLEGELTAMLGNETVVVRPGDLILKPRGQFHTFWNAGKVPVRFLEIITPGGFERYFEELARIIPSDGPPNMGAIAALGGRYGLEFNFNAIPTLIEEQGLRLGV